MDICAKYFEFNTIQEGRSIQNQIKVCIVPFLSSDAYDEFDINSLFMKQFTLIPCMHEETQYILCSCDVDYTIKASNFQAHGHLEIIHLCKKETYIF